MGGASSRQNDIDLDRYYTISPNITILARENVRLTVEGLFKIERDKGNAEGNTVLAKNSEAFKWIKLNTLFAF